MFFFSPSFHFSAPVFREQSLEGQASRIWQCSQRRTTHLVGKLGDILAR